MSAEEQTKLIGAHQLVFEGDVVLMRQRGDYSFDDAQRVSSELEAAIARWGRLFMILDQTRAGSTPPESRRFVADWNKRHTLGGVVIFGGSPTVRAIARMVTTAIRLIRRDGLPIAFTADEAEARQWVASQRAILPGAV